MRQDVIGYPMGNMLYEFFSLPPFAFVSAAQSDIAEWIDRRQLFVQRLTVTRPGRGFGMQCH